MITRDQADKAADALLHQSKKKLKAKQEKLKRAKLVSAERQKSKIPLIEAFVVAVVAYGSLDYIDYSGNTLLPVMLGAAIGGLFGWAIRGI